MVYRIYKVYLEPTNKCNLSCKYCIRSSWLNVEYGTMPIRTLLKIANELTRYPELKEINISGFGEPLIYPNLVDYLKVLRRLLRDTEITIITNGVLLKEIIDHIGRYLSKIFISVDTLDPRRLTSMRKGIHYNKLIDAIKYVVEKRRIYGYEIYFSTIISSDNINDLRSLIMKASLMDINGIYLNNLIVYNKALDRIRMYTTLPRELIVLRKEIYEIVKYIIDGMYERFIKGRETLAKRYHLPKDQINIIGFIDEATYVERSCRALEYVNELTELANRQGIILNTPKFQPSLRELGCPYINEHVIAINWSGLVYPCLQLMYDHVEYVDGHKKIYYSYSLGDIMKEDLDNILDSEKYLAISSMLKYGHVPYCGNCPFSRTGCIFVTDNMLDCLGNTPSCSECLFYLHLVRCP